MDKKVLAFVPSVKEGDGITKVYMSYYQGLIDNGFAVDFLILDSETDAFYSNVICENGGSVYSVPKGKTKYDKIRINYIRRVLEDNGYSIVHDNIPGPNGRILLGIARDEKVPVRIYHAHNPRNNLSIKSRLSGMIYYKRCIDNANFLMACSDSAGKSVFKNREFKVLHNAIDPRIYAYDEYSRLLIRAEYHLENKIIIGTACRMEYQKNPFFLIDCFYEFYSRNMQAVLLWLGDGSLKNKIIDYCRKKGIEDKVIFAGVQKNVEKWYSAMDMFILPSKFEGLGMVFLEAQANGLPCLGSSEIPSDTEITELMHRIPISNGSKEWSIEIEKLLNDKPDRNNHLRAFKMTGYDLNFENKKLAEIYNNLINE